jgi:hypothetical protein
MGHYDEQYDRMDEVLKGRANKAEEDRQRNFESLREEYGRIDAHNNSPKTDYLKEWNKKGMKRVIHAPTGETALCRPIFNAEDFVVLQFDRIGHPGSHCWFIYPKSEVLIIEEEEESDE